MNRLAIFDCDGTLVDSGATHLRGSVGYVRRTWRSGASARGEPPGHRAQPRRGDGGAGAGRGAPPACRAGGELQTAFPARSRRGPCRGTALRRALPNCSMRWKPTDGCSLSQLASPTAACPLCLDCHGYARPLRLAPDGRPASVQAAPVDGRFRRWPMPVLRRKRRSSSAIRRTTWAWPLPLVRPASALAGAITKPEELLDAGAIAVADAPLDVLDILDRPEKGSMADDDLWRRRFLVFMLRGCSDSRPSSSVLRSSTPICCAKAAGRGVGADHRDRRRDRRGLRAQAAQEAVGAARTANAGEALLEAGAGCRARGGWGVELDGKPLRTPAREPADRADRSRSPRPLRRNGMGSRTTIDPRAMPLTGLANAAIDRVAPDKRGFRRRAGSICGGRPRLLSRRRAAAPWSSGRPSVGRAARPGRGGATTSISRRPSGIVHVEQPRRRSSGSAHAVAALDPFRLAGLSPLVTIGGSLVAALAVLEGAFTPDQAWEAVSVDERWQLEQWGSDAEAEAALDNRRRDFMAAARFLELLELSARADELADEGQELGLACRVEGVRRRRLPARRPGIRSCRR